ncbi:glucans biosynthesis protein G [Waddlia chondrophila 2032/99]|uniref:Glucans biosynthesis protein G n=2 Tax=Waddlia chondrophila TaxID=71667 RepID=F8LAS4_9BACT|nr:glucan biosynthesis protein G [Waddlia chondrophila]ADI37393.1 putative Glucans biosynthesis protein G precursor [Waddlia chondrophila WSU 86-1044]CCB90585.1 glucans biosynthesis protein G [Waddlia chondrophila 2032/99]
MKDQKNFEKTVKYLTKATSILCFFSMLTASLHASNLEDCSGPQCTQSKHPEAPAETFGRSYVIQIARELSRKPYAASENTLPSCLNDLSYDEFRKIRYKPDSAIWKGEDLPFQLQLLHRSSYFKDKVDIAIIEGNQIVPIPYNKNLFTFEDEVKCELTPEEKEIGYSGFRIHFPLNTPDYFDELIVFQGATYFRALGRGNSYGISARGLALKTAEPTGEEFPLFKAFWIEKPAKEADRIIVHALLDSPSVTGAYRFTIIPGENTIVEVETTLFPRVELTKTGFAPLTSMFFHSMNGRGQVDDFRPEVHDSDGLLIINGKGEHLWRPLSNPKQLQVSAFLDKSVQGYGLMQRERSFRSYEDLESHYEKRPSLWILPEGNWGDGSVVLVEIPTDSEVHDNIVAFWQSKDPLKAESEFHYSYRMIWGFHPVEKNSQIFVSRTARGRADIFKPSKSRLFIIDYEVPREKPEKMPEPIVSASSGKISNVVLRNNPITHGYRLSFEFDEWGNKPAELRAELKAEGAGSIETWLYRLTD